MPGKIESRSTSMPCCTRRPYTAKPGCWRGESRAIVYFGGGTPSFLSVEQLTQLFTGLQKHFPWDDIEEVAFESEPGTLTDEKLHALRDLGVTRLSLGVENFDDEILRSNGRAHLSNEIYRAYEVARAAGFPQINIDLIAGMLNETETNWKECVRKTIEMGPDSVTVYQLEVPLQHQDLQGNAARRAKLSPRWRTGRPRGHGSIWPFWNWRRPATRSPAATRRSATRPSIISGIASSCGRGPT